MTSTTAPSSAPPRRALTGSRGRDAAVVLLAALSGTTDAIGLLALGGSFTSVMTGNLVFVGVRIGTGEATALGLTLAAIGGYALGVLAGARIAGEPEATDHVWPARVTRGLTVELACFLVSAALWWSAGSDPGPDLYAVLLAVNAVALGIQSSVIIRFGVNGLSTTYMTGTLTTMLARIAARHPLASLGRSGALLTGLVAGAAVGGLCYAHSRPLVPVVQLVLIAGALVTGLRVQRHADGLAA